jgi:hypothetical protein
LLAVFPDWALLTRPFCRAAVKGRAKRDWIGSRFSKPLTRVTALLVADLLSAISNKEAKRLEDITTMLTAGHRQRKSDVGSE